MEGLPHSTAEYKRVKAVQFGVISPDELVRSFTIGIRTSVSSGIH